MTFLSLSFALFFCVLVMLHFWLPQKYRPALLLAASYIFCTTLNISYTIFLAGSTAVNYALGRLFSVSCTKNCRNILLLAGITFNLSALILFRYTKIHDDFSAPFLLRSFQSPSWFSSNVAFPIGISFYTFQALAYLVDVYRERIQPERSPIIFTLFMAFFPQVISGPIPRASQLIPQFRRYIQFDEARAVDGLRLILWGVVKKVVIADRFGIYVAAIYDHPFNYSGLPLFLATILFAFQIYCDFSGYTNIVIGLAKILGYDLIENFRQPYFALSIYDFWQRWHISLSTWIRDYLFFPLTRLSLRMTNHRWPRLLQLLVSVLVMALIGLWHGFAWTFVIWGVLQGLYLGLMAWFRSPRSSTHVSAPLTTISAGLLTFLAVCFAWIFFRAASLDSAIYIVTHLFRFSGDILTSFDLKLNMKPAIQLGVALLLIGGVLAADWLSAHANVNRLLSSRPVWIRWGLYYAMLMVIVLLGASGSQTFIYFLF